MFCIGNIITQTCKNNCGPPCTSLILTRNVFTKASFIYNKYTNIFLKKKILPISFSQFIINILNLLKYKLKIHILKIINLSTFYWTEILCWDYVWNELKQILIQVWVWNAHQLLLQIKKIISFVLCKFLYLSSL